jgi:hypothetical protein
MGQIGTEKDNSPSVEDDASRSASKDLESELAKRFLTAKELGDSPAAKVLLSQLVEALNDNCALKQEVGDSRQDRFDFYERQIDALKRQGDFLNILLFLAGALFSLTPYFWEKGEMLRGGLVAFFALSIAVAEVFIFRERKRVAPMTNSRSPRQSR